MMSVWWRHPIPPLDVARLERERGVTTLVAIIDFLPRGWQCLDRSDLDTFDPNIKLYDTECKKYDKNLQSSGPLMSLDLSEHKRTPTRRNTIRVCHWLRSALRKFLLPPGNEHVYHPALNKSKINDRITPRNGFPTLLDWIPMDWSSDPCREALPWSSRPSRQYVCLPYDSAQNGSVGSWRSNRSNRN